MAGGFPLFGSFAKATNYGLSGTDGTTVTASGSTNTKGAWTQLTASTAVDIGALMVETGLPGTSSAFFGTDIGIGAAGSEVVIINNLIGFRLDAAAGSPVTIVIGYLQPIFPVVIPAGTRIAARCQSSKASDTIAVQVWGFATDFTAASGVARIDSLGFDTTVSKGTAVTPGGTAPNKGNYAQLIASTVVDYAGFYIGWDPNALTNNDFFNITLDIAIGEAGKELIIFPDYAIISPGLSGTAVLGPSQCISPFVPIPIPAGTRIAARCATANGTLPIGVTLYGVPQ